MRMNTGKCCPDAANWRGLWFVAWCVCGLSLAFGFLSWDPVFTLWNLIFLPVHAIPAVLLVFGGRRLAQMSCCAGMCLVIHGVVSLLAPDPDFHSLPPRMSYEGVTTDELGFRTTPQVDYRAHNAFRIAVIGGSTAEEIHRHDTETWPYLLQEKLKSATGRRVEVINTGLSGMRMRHHAATLRRIIKYKPDMVIVLAGINDWNEHIKQEFSPWHEPNRFHKISRCDWRNRLLARNTIVGRSLIRLRYNRVFGLGRADVLARLDRPGSLERSLRLRFLPSETYPEYAHYMRVVSDLCRRDGILCLWLTQPTAYWNGVSSETRAKFWMTPPRQEYTLTLDSLIHISRLYNGATVRGACFFGDSFFDLASQFYSQEEMFTDDCHFTQRGSERVADLLMPVVLEMIDRCCRGKACLQ